MYDPTDNTVWCDTFSGCTWSNFYQNKLIRCIYLKGTLGNTEEDKKVTMKQIEKIIREEF